MTTKTGSAGEDKERETVSVTLPPELAHRLKEFCREFRVPADKVVERALVEYFREGDMSH